MLSRPHVRILSCLQLALRHRPRRLSLLIPWCRRPPCRTTQVPLPSRSDSATVRLPLCRWSRRRLFRRRPRGQAATLVPSSGCMFAGELGRRGRSLLVGTMCMEFPRISASPGRTSRRVDVTCGPGAAAGSVTPGGRSARDTPRRHPTNSVNLIGGITKVPEFRTMAGGTSITTLLVGTDRLELVGGKTVRGEDGYTVLIVIRVARQAQTPQSALDLLSTVYSAVISRSSTLFAGQYFQDSIRVPLSRASPFRT